MLDCRQTVQPQGVPHTGRPADPRRPASEGRDNRRSALWTLVGGSVVLGARSIGHNRPILAGNTASY